MELVGQPRLRVGVEVPTDCIRAELVECIERIYCVTLGLGHLLTVLILYMAQNDDVLIRSLVEEDGGLSHEGVEPATGLVNCFRDELRRELLLKYFLILERIMMLCERHCTRVKPAVNNFRNTTHGLATIRAGVGEVIDVRAMKLYGERVFTTGLLLELSTGSDGILMSTSLTLPDVKRSTPVTVTGDTPVLNVL